MTLSGLPHMESHSGLKWSGLLLRSSFQDNRPRCPIPSSDVQIHPLRIDTGLSDLFSWVETDFYQSRIIFTARALLPVENFLAGPGIFFTSPDFLFTGRDVNVNSRH